VKGSVGWPGKEAMGAPLASTGALEVGKIRNVELLGHKGKLTWTQDEAGLKVELPEEKPSDHAVTLKVALGKATSGRSGAASSRT
jgi:alpha-L-fucosidase